MIFFCNYSNNFIGEVIRSARSTNKASADFDSSSLYMYVNIVVVKVPNYFYIIPIVPIGLI